MTNNKAGFLQTAKQPLLSCCLTSSIALLLPHKLAIYCKSDQNVVNLHIPKLGYKSARPIGIQLQKDLHGEKCYEEPFGRS